MLKFNNIRNILILATLYFSNAAYGQRIINAGLHAGSGLSSINTRFPEFVKNVKSNGGLNFNFRITGKYFLSEKFGAASGFEILSFNQKSSASSTYENFPAYYAENQQYERRVWGDSITEDINLNILHIPLQMFYQHKFNNAVSVFGSFGPGISFPIKSTKKAHATFTYKGYFPDEKALLWDIPLYGLASDVEIKTEEKLLSNPVFLNIGASLGVELSMNRYYRFVATAGYYRSITNVAKNGKSIHISNEIGSHNSLLNVGQNNLNSYWFTIGISKNILF